MKINKNKIVLRYLVFLLGVIFNAYGVVFITKANLGNTPISSIPYTLSLIIPVLTLGTATIIISMILIALQFIILRKKSNVIEILLQIPICIVFGSVIDFAMWTMSFLNPSGYVFQLLSLIAGCIILAFGAYLEVVADVTMLPADGFARAITKVTNMKFGNVKLITDSSQAFVALILGFIFLHGFAGVREGTVIAAIIVGNLVKLFAKTIKLDRMFD